MGRITVTLFIFLFVVISFGCSSDDSLPDFITPEEDRYSVVISSHNSGEEWEEVIKHYVDSEILQIITYGIDSPPVQKVMNDYDIEVEDEIIALVFDHKQFVFKTTNPQELAEFFEDQN